MNLVEQIQLKAAQLPEHLQAQVLDYLEFLATKYAESKQRQEDVEWSALSLKVALRGMEDEDTSDYEHVKFVEKWK
jgi:hypothetical protein